MVCFFRGNQFRTAYQEVSSLPKFFRGIPYVAMSGTITTELMQRLPVVLGMGDPTIISVNPDRPNIYLDLIPRPPSLYQEEAYEAVIVPECKRLYREKENYPVTLIYCSFPCNSRGQRICLNLFEGKDKVDIYTTALFSSIFSSQCPNVVRVTEQELKKRNPRIRLVFCTAAVGMGFDSPAVSRVIHMQPPRNILDYMQQFGRAGRLGQSSEAVLYYNRNDIAPNLPGLKQDIVDYCNSTSCLRQCLLSKFGYEPVLSCNPKCKCCKFCKVTCLCSNCLKW